MSPLTQKVLEALRPACSTPNIEPELIEHLRLWRAAGCPDIPPSNEVFGEWLTRVRRSKGVTLRTLSERLGGTPSRFSRIDNNQKRLCAKEWLQICEELSLSAEERQAGEALLLQLEALT